MCSTLEISGHVVAILWQSKKGWLCGKSGLLSNMPNPWQFLFVTFFLGWWAKTYEEPTKKNHDKIFVSFRQIRVRFFNGEWMGETLAVCVGCTENLDLQPRNRSGNKFLNRSWLLKVVSTWGDFWFRIFFTWFLFSVLASLLFRGFPFCILR